METARKIILIVSIVFALLVFLYFLPSLEPQSPEVAPGKPGMRALPVERSHDKLWSPQTEALVEAFPERKPHLELLREMMGRFNVSSVVVFDDNLSLYFKKGLSAPDDEELDRPKWSELVKMAGANQILTFERPQSVGAIFLPGEIDKQELVV